MRFAVKNPATGEELATHSSSVQTSSADDVRAAISDAYAVFKEGTWSKAPLDVRSSVLAQLAQNVAENIDDLAKMESLQTGRPIREMKAQLLRVPEWLIYFASVLRTHQGFVAPTDGPLLNYVQRVPLGVVAQITPFNHPLFIAIKKLAPALAAGNSVIVKPSEHAPCSVLELADMAEAAGLPNGVLSVLPGFGKTTGMNIISNPMIRKVDVTGGTIMGRDVGAIVGRNLAAYNAELGGKAPVVVFDDADPESAANGAAFACFVASGQTCISGTRLIVQEQIYDDFMRHFLHKVETIKLRMGDPLNPKTMMGTVISEQQVQRIQDMVDRRSKKSKILAGGQRLTGTSSWDGFDFSKGAFYPPTVIANISTDEDLWREEVFGPVVVVKKFTDESEGVTLANACKYGLGAGIWTQNLSRAHRVAADIEAGLVWVNTHHRNDPSSPWGGMKESGIGRENGIEAYKSCMPHILLLRRPADIPRYADSQTKSTIVNIATAEDTRENQDWFALDGEDRRYG
ncbi:hypothetical protein NM688_g3834 [Phlebia brevispora]|uniref:Uncharacterized protein n=1 Tax=Phlebia brevispora TaxID=194682 RepID=A0ACC1T4T8_9APHY|nr:hypothetical protein NM688_g3834 [Phlebia brevispora]